MLNVFTLVNGRLFQEEIPSAEALVWQLRHLRRAPSQLARIAPRASTPDPPVRKQDEVPRELHVLIVEDDPDLARVLGFYVRHALGDVETRTAPDGVAALEAVRLQPPDVVLVDLHMPRMNGVELCMHLRGDARTGNCVIIPVSAGAQQDDHELLRQLGVHQFVPKGADLKQRLTEALQEAISVPASDPPSSESSP